MRISTTIAAAGCVLLAQMTTPAQATNQVVVLSFNLRYASAADGANNWINSGQSPERRQVALQVIQNHQPDLVGFQEGEDSQLDYLAANLPGYAFERRKPSGGGGNENAAFAWNTNNLRLLDCGVFSLGPSPGGGFWHNTPGTNFNPYLYFPDMGLPFPRLALWGRFHWLASGQDMLFYTTHFDFSNTPQVASAQLIIRDAQARNDRMPASPLAVVVGDFNSSHLNRDWQLFTGAYSTNGVTGDFTDSWFQVHGTWNNSGTFHGFAGGVKPENERIDWILHRGGFTASSAQILYDSVTATNLGNGSTRTQFPSDHYPVKATLLLPPVAPDYDRDGLPDAREAATPRTLGVDADSDNDGLLDGEEDINGNGTTDGGETDPSAYAQVQLPTDIRNYQMDGFRDRSASLFAANGLELWAAFDGRYLYLATQDTGEGNDHFIFVCTSPSDPVNAPWQKSGLVSRWIAYLAGENDNKFNNWFDAGGAMITNLFTARSDTLHQNGGWLEGVLDLGLLIGAGFTSNLYLAAAPYGNADGGSLISSAQVPPGNGDGNILDASEYVLLAPGDDDGDGLSNHADPDRDGDGLPDEWETAYGLDGAGLDDADADGSSNSHEFLACTNPTNQDSVFAISATAGNALHWQVPFGKTTSVWRLSNPSFSTTGDWQFATSSANNITFPTLTTGITQTAYGAFIQLRQSP